MPFKSIAFPKNSGQRYWDKHYAFFKNLTEAAGIKVNLRSGLHNGCDDFEIRVNGLRILIVYGDHMRTLNDVDKFDLVFRYHYWKSKTKGDNVFPLTPISFLNWNQYWSNKDRINFKSNSKMIRSNQEPRAAAKKRRETVQLKLEGEYGRELDVSLTDQLTFWRKISGSLVGVFVPGARKDILDRGQLQWMAFGGCTISPKLKATLPFGVIPESGVHYIACKDSYSDLIAKIEWVREHQWEAVQIGQNAGALFETVCTPKRVWEWIEEVVQEHRKPKKVDGGKPSELKIKYVKDEGFPEIDFENETIPLKIEKITDELVDE